MEAPALLAVFGELADEYRGLVYDTEAQSGKGSGRRGDIVRMLLAHTSLEGAAYALGQPIERVVRDLLPPALKARWQATVEADVRLRAEQSTRQVSAELHLPRGFVEQLASWQASDLDLSAKRRAAELCLGGVGATAACRQAEIELDAQLPLSFRSYLARKDNEAVIRDRYGL